MSGTCGDGADGSESGVGAKLGMIAGASAVAAALASGNVAAALAVTSGEATFYQSAIGEEESSEDYRSFGAANWKELLRKIAEATDDVEKKFNDACKSIIKSANNRVEEISTDRDKFYVVNSGM
jgi:hypothetical protein